MLNLPRQSLNFRDSAKTFRISKNFLDTQKPFEQSRAFPDKFLLLRAKTFRMRKQFLVGNADISTRFLGLWSFDAVITKWLWMEWRPAYLAHLAHFAFKRGRSRSRHLAEKRDCSLHPMTSQGITKKWSIFLLWLLRPGVCPWQAPLPQIFSMDILCKHLCLATLCKYST